MVKPEVIWATGRRKNSIARIRIKPGQGTLTVNGQKMEEYFHRPTSQMIIQQPLEITKTADKYDIIADVQGGGVAGQAGAVRLGVARALVAMEEGLRTVLRRGGYLTRDPREKERKKYGKHSARRSTQYSKR